MIPRLVVLNNDFAAYNGSTRDVMRWVGKKGDVCIVVGCAPQGDGMRYILLPDGNVCTTFIENLDNV